MITISTEWLTEHWEEISSPGGAGARFSAWDENDAFTLVGASPTRTGTEVEGRVFIGTVFDSNAPIRVQLDLAESFPDSTRANVFPAPDGNDYIATGIVMLSSEEPSQEVRVIDIGSQLDSRRSPILETNVLSDNAVMVIGLGTGGAYVAVELAKCGVGNFVLVDGDRLDVANLSRHLAGLSQVGRAKVLVTRDLILESNPAAEVDTYQISAETSNEHLIKKLIEQADLVIGATDTRVSKLFLNRLCVGSNRTAIYGGAFRRAYGGQVLRVRPSSSPCYQCFVLSMPDEEADREISSEEEAEALAYSDLPGIAEPGLSLDVAPIAHMVAKLALQELLIGKESELNVLDSDFTAPWYFWINRPEANTPYQDLPPLSEASEEMTIMRWYGVHLEREFGCPECGDFDANARQIYDFADGELPEIGARPLPQFSAHEPESDEDP